MPNFGIEFFGAHAIIKLRVKVSDADMTRISNQFPNLHVHYGARGTVAIEGCLLSNQYRDFKNYIKDCTLTYKIAKLEQERAGLWAPEGAFIMDIDDDLPF